MVILVNEGEVEGLDDGGEDVCWMEWKEGEEMIEESKNEG